MTHRTIACVCECPPLPVYSLLLASSIIDRRAIAAYPRKPITSVCMVQQVEFVVCGAQSGKQQSL